jgi:coenzyme Q-binding protein COQ10
MFTADAARELPFTREQVYEVAADVERYPEFLPWWISAHIASRDAQSCRVQQVLGFGPLQLAFDTTATFQRPERIDVSSSEPPFRHYQLCMQFDAASPAACRLRVASTVELESALMQRIADRLLPRSIERIVLAFETRSRSLYGPPHD